MNKSLEMITKEVERLYQQYSKLVKIYYNKCWKDTRREVIEEQEQDTLLSDLKIYEIVPKRKMIPLEFKEEYQNYYSSCCALLEKNYNTDRTREFKEIYEKHIVPILSSKYIAQNSGYHLLDTLENQILILKALPDYVRQRAPTIEFTIAFILMEDELLEAEHLLKKGHIRAAGAISGVVLERQLKMRCDKNDPKIKYSKKASIGKLNDLLKSNNIIDQVEWRKIQYLGDIRNKCDHDHKSAPKAEDVEDMISKVKEIVHYN